jgi:hypothetical protein
MTDKWVLVVGRRLQIPAFRVYRLCGDLKHGLSTFRAGDPRESNTGRNFL